MSLNLYSPREISAFLTAHGIRPSKALGQNFLTDRNMIQRIIDAAQVQPGTRVLEIGTGSGYGVALIAPHADRFLTVDKTVPPPGIVPEGGNVEFRRMTIPPLKGLPSGCMDYVICFQVIEHIRDDFGTIAEIQRVLKPNGQLLISTPNKAMSLTRNPWHLREYTVDEFKGLIGCYFDHFEAFGVYGNGKVMQYYEENKRAVERITRYDFLRLQYRLPAPLLRLPYDILNRINRRRLLRNNDELTTSICADDYYLKKADDQCFDLFFIATKQ